MPLEQAASINIQAHKLTIRHSFIYLLSYYFNLYREFIFNY